MTLRLQITCMNEYRCQCKPIPQTRVSKEQIAYNLVRCNPALARYFSNRITQTETVVESNVGKQKEQSPYKSIVEERNLNILLTDRHPIPSQPGKQLHQRQQTTYHPKTDNYINTYVQTSPKSKNPPKPKPSQTEQQLRNYYRQLKQTSRYLPDTAFRKYFNRQVFENYGRQNIHGTGDGIVYGNYMKTHNVNPHAGDNRPNDEETFYHALVSASPEKLLSPDLAKLKEKEKEREREKNQNLSQSRFKENESAEKPLKKHENKPDEVIMDNLYQHDKLNRLEQTKEALISSNSRKVHFKEVTSEKFIAKNSPLNQQKIPQANSPKSPRIQSQYVNTKQHIQPVNPQNKKVEFERTEVPKFVSRGIQTDQINGLSSIKTKEVSKKEKCPVDVIRQNNMDHILSKQCHVKKQKSSIKKPQQLPQKHEIQKLDFGPGSPKACICKGLERCRQCLSPLKKQLKQKAQQDVDLSNRLIGSARKTALYKNYALNNVQNRNVNPHNYSRCCGKIYEG